METLMIYKVVTYAVVTCTVCVEYVTHECELYILHIYTKTYVIIDMH